MLVRRDKHVAFQKRPRRHRKLAYISTKNDIQKAASVLGGVFCTHDYMHDLTQWIDFEFLSQHSMVFYNGTISTCRSEFAERITELALERAEELVPSHTDFFATGTRDDREFFQLAEPKKHEQFDGLTRYDWAKTQYADILKNEPPVICTSCSLEHDYASGIGLHVCVDEPVITIAVVNAFISDFLANREKPLPAVECNFTHEALQFVYKNEDGQDVSTNLLQNPVLSNALCDPWEWPED